MTKYIGGKSEDLGGSISGKEELINQLLDLNSGKRMLGGGVMAPRVAKEFIHNLKDLPERLHRATVSAKAVKQIAQKNGVTAKFIEEAENFSVIRNKNLPESTISNGMVSLYFDTQDQAHEFIDTMIQLGIGKGAVSLGAGTTYYSIPAETTHSELDEEAQEKVGITPGLVRVSCGEEPDLAEKVKDVLWSMFQ
jgi:methionine-gamma-lyase